MTDDSHENEPKEKESVYEERLRKCASWIAVIGTSLLAVCFNTFLIIQLWKPGNPTESWMLEVLDKHFAATLGVPLSAISSACLVLLLKAATGPIEFEGMGFKFRGASGPIILWILCFLAMILGIYLLWNR